eukprot:gene13179-15569_t
MTVQMQVWTPTMTTIWLVAVTRKSLQLSSSLQVDEMIPDLLPPFATTGTSVPIKRVAKPEARGNRNQVSVMSSGASFGNKEKDVEMLDVPTVRAPESEHAPRAYQLDIVDEAKRANVIALLPTGAGKTFVATLVIKAKADLLLHQKQLAVFVVPRK